MRFYAALSLGLLLVGTPAVADATTFTTIDISSYLNNNQSINPQTMPVGLSNGNQSTGIPFQTYAYGLNGYMGSWLGSAGTVDISLTALGLTGQHSFYALLNNYYGTANANEYNITIKGTNGASVTYQSIGGVDTRDYNSNVFTNTVANTTSYWYDNGIGQRLDVREFDLPTAFATETITDFIIAQVNSRDVALFGGLTFSDAAAQPLVTPLPATLPLLLGGVGVFGFVARRRKCRNNTSKQAVA